MLVSNRNRIRDRSVPRERRRPAETPRPVSEGLREQPTKTVEAPFQNEAVSFLTDNRVLARQLESRGSDCLISAVLKQFDVPFHSLNLAPIQSRTTAVPCAQTGQVVVELDQVQAPLDLIPSDTKSGRSMFAYTYIELEFQRMAYRV